MPVPHEFFDHTGYVYKVEHTITGRREAMKVLAASNANATEQAERFLREIRFQASLSHPKIAPQTLFQFGRIALHPASRSDKKYRKYQRTAHRMRAGSVCRHLKIAGRVAIADCIQPTSLCISPVATQPAVG